MVFSSSPLCSLLDFGLVADIPSQDKPILLTAIVHMANRDWQAVTEDFVGLGFLPGDVDRGIVNPVLERILAPYVLSGGGAKAFIGEGVFSPSFQNLAKDLSRAAIEIPFSIPPQWSVIGRALAILEGLALKGDENYKMVLAAYPFVTRKLLKEGGGNASFRAALNAILYPPSENGVKQARPSPRRVVALINSALGRVAASSESAVLLDLDAVPDGDDAASLTESIAFLGSDKAGAIRDVLVDELSTCADLVLRSTSRRIATIVAATTSIPIPFFPSIPFMPRPRLPFFNPLSLIPDGTRDAALDRVSPPLTQDEEIYVGDILELSNALLGVDIRDVLAGSLASPQQALSLVGPVLSGFVRRDASSFRDGSPDGSGKELLELILTQPRNVSSSSPRRSIEADARAALESIGKDVVDKLLRLQGERLGFREV
jgi:aarF domain-containing kinase